jgi:hypothetical protein
MRRASHGAGAKTPKWDLLPDDAKPGELGLQRVFRMTALPCFGRGVGADPISLGHVSVQTTERYFGWEQRIRSAVNDRIGIEPNP